MKHGSLFSGIGGFDLAAEWMGWTNVFHTECNEFGQKVLKHHFPQSISYHDIIKTDYSIHNGDIDIITGGFPCQPFSNAGKRKGTDDERYLWHEMLRAIQQIQPTYVVAENVRGLLNIDGGMVFEQVCLDLESEGYEIQPVLLPAAGVNAPHRRDRIFIVGYAANSSVTRLERSTRTSEEWKHVPTCKSESDGWKKVVFASDCEAEEWDTDRECIICPECKGQYAMCECPGPTQEGYQYRYIEAIMYAKPAANTKEIRLQRCKQADSSKRQESNDQFTNGCSRKWHSSWMQFPTESAICGGNDGLPTELDNITFSKWRNESIKAYGNAVVPQLIMPIFQTIEKLHREKNT